MEVIMSSKELELQNKKIEQLDEIIKLLTEIADYLQAMKNNQLYGITKD